MRRPAQICQVPGCNADLTNLRSYFVRQHICEEHARADAVPDGRGGFLRFCQQCTKLEPVAAFEGLKRSCEASLQKRHLRRSGGAAAAQRAKSGSSGGMALNAAAFNAAALHGNAGMMSLPHMMMPGNAQANHAASAAAMAAMLAGVTGDRGSPSSTASLQHPAATTRSTSGLRGGGGGAAPNPLAALLEAALPGGGVDLDAGGPVPIADLPPLASNSRDGSMLLQHLAGHHAGLPHMPRPHPQAQGQDMHHALHQGGVSWPLPNSAPWAPQQSSFSQLQAALSAAATDTRLPPFPSGNSSKLSVEQAGRQDAQPAVGSAATGMHEGQPPQVDVQQMVGALHLLQQLQDVIGSLLVAQVQQQQAPAPPPGEPAYRPHHSQQQQQLLSLLGGLAGGSQQAAPPPQPPPPQLQQQEDGQHSQAVLQLLSQLAQQQNRQQHDQQQHQQNQQNQHQQQQHQQHQQQHQQHHQQHHQQQQQQNHHHQQHQQLHTHNQQELPQPAVSPQPRSAAGSPAPQELPPGLEAQLLQAAAGGTGGVHGEQLHALLRRWAAGTSQSELA